MRIVYIAHAREEHAFAEKAAAHFAAHPEHTSYTDGAIKSGVFLALRWGLHERAVAVMRIDAEHEPVIYGDLIPPRTDEP